MSDREKKCKPGATPYPIFGEAYLLKDGKIYKRCRECNGWSERTNWLNNGDHTYRCKRCRCFEGCPTEWALCSVRGIISRDNAFNDCWRCDIYVKMKVTYDPQGPRPCPKFVRLLKFAEVYNHPSYMREKGLRIIEV